MQRHFQRVSFWYHRHGEPLDTMVALLARIEDTMPERTQLLQHYRPLSVKNGNQLLLDFSQLVNKALTMLDTRTLTGFLLADQHIISDPTLSHLLYEALNQCDRLWWEAVITKHTAAPINSFFKLSKDTSCRLDAPALNPPTKLQHLSPADLLLTFTLF